VLEQQGFDPVSRLVEFLNFMFNLGEVVGLLRLNHKVEAFKLSLDRLLDLPRRWLRVLCRDCLEAGVRC
jgi:hypothetical protein